MCLIDVPNFKEIKTTGRLFLCGSNILQKQCEEGEGEEKWAIFGSVYLVHH